MARGGTWQAEPEPSGLRKEKCVKSHLLKRPFPRYEKLRQSCSAQLPCPAAQTPRQRNGRLGLGKTACQKGEGASHRVLGGPLGPCAWSAPCLPSRSILSWED